MPVRFPILMPDGSIHDQDCLTVAELAARLHATKESVYRKTGSGEWPCFKPVRQVYFTPEHVRQILAMSEHHGNGCRP